MPLYMDEPRSQLILPTSGEEEEQMEHLTEGAQVATAWLQEVWALRPTVAAVHIAGDADPMWGAFVNPKNETNWVVYLTFGGGGKVEIGYNRIPLAVLESLDQALSQQR